MPLKIQERIKKEKKNYIILAYGDAQLFSLGEYTTLEKSKEALDYLDGEYNKHKLISEMPQDSDL